MFAHHDAAYTEKWLRGVKDNLARKAAGGDRDVARDILAGICDIGIANAYYVGRMKNAEPGSEQHQWGEAIKVIRPVFATDGGGTHVNISGAAVARPAPNRDNAVALMEYLVSDEAPGDRRRVASGTSVSVRVDLGGRGLSKQKKYTPQLVRTMKLKKTQ